MEKNFQINGRNIIIEGELKMKHLRQIYPIINNGKINEIDLLYKLCEILFISIDGDKNTNTFIDFIDNLPAKELEKITKEIMDVYKGLEKKSM